MTRTRAAAGGLLALVLCHTAFKVRLSTAAFDCDQSGYLAEISDSDRDVNYCNRQLNEEVR